MGASRNGRCIGWTLGAGGASNVRLCTARRRLSAPEFIQNVGCRRLVLARLRPLERVPSRREKLLHCSKSGRAQLLERSLLPSSVDQMPRSSSKSVLNIGEVAVTISFSASRQGIDRVDRRTEYRASADRRPRRSGWADRGGRPGHQTGEAGTGPQKLDNECYRIRSEENGNNDRQRRRDWPTVAGVGSLPAARQLPGVR